MPIAYKEETGEAVYLDQSGNWVPAKVAENPNTGERLAYDGKDWVPIQTKGRKSSYGFSDAVPYGMTMGAAEEVGALGSAAADAVYSAATGDWDKYSFKDSFNEALRRKDMSRKKFHDENPILAPATEIVGGVMTGTGLLKNAGGKALSMAPQATKPITTQSAIGTGLGLGATAGALESNNDRTQGAIIGGGAGGVAGAAAPWLVNVASKYGRPVIDKLFRRWGAQGPKTAAQRHLLQSLERQDLTPDMAMARIDELGDGAALVDVAPRLGEKLATTDEAARNVADDFLTTRQQGMHTRVTGATNEGLDVSGQYHTSLKKLYEGRA